MRKVFLMNKPVRLGKVEEPKPLSSMMFIHPATVIIAGLIMVVILSALIFAVSGGSAVESGGMRNFLANI